MKNLNKLKKTQIDKFKQMSDEVLLKHQRLLKGITYAFAGMLILLSCLNIFDAIVNGLSAFTVIPFVLLSILILNLSNLNKIKIELADRNLR